MQIQSVLMTCGILVGCFAGTVGCSSPGNQAPSQPFPQSPPQQQQQVYPQQSLNQYRSSTSGAHLTHSPGGSSSSHGSSQGTHSLQEEKTRSAYSSQDRVERKGLSSNSISGKPKSSDSSASSTSTV